MTISYQESLITGTQWLRASGVRITNPLNEVGRIAFIEERVTALPDRIITEPNAVLDDIFDPEHEIELLDINTGQPTGQTVLEAFLYQALYSKYIALAFARDAAEQPQT